MATSRERAPGGACVAFSPGRVQLSALFAPDIVVEDPPDARWVADQRVTADRAQVDGKPLVGFGFRVAVNDDRDGLAGLASRERQRTALGLIVVVADCGAAVGSG